MFDLSNRESINATFLGESTTGNVPGGDIHVEDPANDIVLAEALFLSSLNSEEISNLAEDGNQLTQLIDEGILTEKTIIKFDKAAKLSRAESQAVLIIAREKKDRDFNKLIRVWKLRKALLEKLTKKYGSQAKVRAKQNIKNMNRSKAPVAKKVAARNA